MNARTELEILIDLEHTYHQYKADPKVAEADIVRALCGPWWRRCWRPARARRVRLQFRAIAAARAAAAKRLASRPPSRLSPTQTDALVRQIMAGKPVEQLIADMGLDPEQANVARRGALYATGAMADAQRTQQKPLDPITESVLAEAQAAAPGIPAAFNFGPAFNPEPCPAPAPGSLAGLVLRASVEADQLNRA